MQKFTKCDFTDCDFTDANFSFAIMKNCKLTGAELTGTLMSGTTIDEKVMPIDKASFSGIARMHSKNSQKGGARKKTNFVKRNLYKSTKKRTGRK